MLPGYDILPSNYEDVVSAFISEAHYATTGASQALPFTSAQAGDLALIIGIDQVSVGGLSAWSALTPVGFGGDALEAWWKILTSSDITSGSVTVTGTANGGKLMILIYRGPTSLAQKSSASAAAATSVTAAGFTKASNSLCIVTVAAGSSASTFTKPGGTTLRGNQTGNPLAAADIHPADYTNGTGLTWTESPAATNSVAMAYELTG